jgi:hypothetical protein
MDLAAKPLDVTTWPDFARLAEDHRGVWAGCWCLNFHEEGQPGVHAPQQRRELKEARVRGMGVADAALDGALQEIARLGGGRVESYPEDTSGRKVSGSFLYNATVALFERHGFERERQIGKHHWVVSRFIR